VALGSLLEIHMVARLEVSKASITLVETGIDNKLSSLSSIITSIEVVIVSLSIRIIQVGPNTIASRRKINISVNTPDSRPNPTTASGSTTKQSKEMATRKLLLQMRGATSLSRISLQAIGEEIHAISLTLIGLILRRISFSR
jgi:hypothetical protein